MVEVWFGALAQTFELLHTPRALETLGNLAAGKSPYENDDDAIVVGQAIDCLRSVGAVTSSPRPLRLAAGTVTITPWGAQLFELLVEIERMAARRQRGAAPAAGRIVG